MAEGDQDAGGAEEVAGEMFSVNLTRAVSLTSGREKNSHLIPAISTHVVVGQLVGLGIENVAVDDGKLGAFDMGDEEAVGPGGRSLPPGRRACPGRSGVLVSSGSPCRHWRGEELDGRRRRRTTYRRRGRRASRLGMGGNAGGLAFHRTGQSGLALVSALGTSAALLRHDIGPDRVVFSEIAGTGAAGQLFADVLELVFAEFDHVVGAQEVLSPWPLTSVPLVLLRSSRKEIVQDGDDGRMLAGDRRLSIWMSLCGLRPRVMRSLLSAISLSTRPSIERISFAMLPSSSHLNQARNFCNQPAEPRTPRTLTRE